MTNPIYLEDEKLVTRWQSGDDDAYESIDRRYRKKIFQYLLQRSHSSEVAEELTQETFIRALASRRQLKNGRYLSQWLYSIARNSWVDWTRKRNYDVAKAASYDAAERAEESDDVSAQIVLTGKERRPCGSPFPDDSPDALLRQKELRQNVWRIARESLREIEFHMLWAKYVEGDSDEEIAENFGKRVENVRVILFRIRKKLADKLKRYE